MSSSASATVFVIDDDPEMRAANAALAKNRRAPCGGICQWKGFSATELAPGLCLAKTSYTHRINDLAQNWIRTFPIKFLP
jgi:hypothetical protein